MFYMLIIFIAFFASLGMAYRLTHKTELSRPKKIGTFIALFLIWLVPLLIKKSCLVSGETYSFLYHCLYFLYVWVFLFFCFMIVRDAFYGIHSLLKKFKKEEKAVLAWKDTNKINRSNRFLCIIALILTCYSLYAGLKTPDVKEVKLYSNKIHAGITIVALNDLHLHRALSESKLEKIVKEVNLIQPDVVVFVGDLIDDQAAYLHNQLFILSKITAPLGKYAVSGNHEYHIGMEYAQEALREADINYLENEGVQITPNIFLSGVPDFVAERKKMETANVEKALYDAGEDDYKVLLAHRPNFIDTLKPNQIDLQISGHTHGGQIFPFHLIVKYVNNYLAGMYETKNGQLYVSRGSGQWGPQMRLFAPSEITVIRLNSVSHSLPTKISNIMKVKDPISSNEETHTNSPKAQNISDKAENTAENETQKKPVLLPFVKKSKKSTGYNPFEIKEEQSQPKEPQKEFSDRKAEPVETKKELNKQPNETKKIDDSAIDIAVQSPKEPQEESEKIDIHKVIHFVNSQGTSTNEDESEENPKTSDIQIQKVNIQKTESTVPVRPVESSQTVSDEKKTSKPKQEPVKSQKQPHTTNIQGIIEVLETANTNKINQPKQTVEEMNREIEALLTEVKQKEKLKQKEALQKKEKNITKKTQSVQKSVTETKPLQQKETVIRQEELFVEVIKNEGIISHVRIYDANHEIIADTSLKEGKNVQKRILEDANGNLITHETIMHVHSTPEKHITHRTQQVSEGKILKPESPKKEKKENSLAPKKAASTPQKQFKSKTIYSIPTMIPVDVSGAYQNMYQGHEIPPYHYHPSSAYSGMYYYSAPQNRIGY